MHKKPPPDKLDRGSAGGGNAVRGTGSRHNAGTVKSTRGRPDSVKDLLARANPVLAGIARRAREQQGIEAWVRERLPEELTGRVTEVLEKEGELTVFAESAAWAGRLRFAVEDLKVDLAANHPQVREVRVRVMPRRGLVPR